MDRADVEKVLIEEKNKQLEQQGLVPIDTTVASSTVRLYHAVAVQGDDITIPSQARDKDENRYIAERSLISAVTFAAVVAATVYRVGETEQGLDFPKKTTDGAAILRDLVLQAHDGKPIYRVPPHRWVNMDDTITKVALGADDAPKPGGKMTHKKSYKKKKSQSLTNQPGNNEKEPKNIQRVKNSLVFTGTGLMGKVVLTIKLTAMELPEDRCPAGFVAMEIPGLSAGAASDPFNQEVGYILLMRSKERSDCDMEKARYRWLRQNIMLPLVQRVRERYDEHMPGVDVPDELTAVVSCDGDLGQVAVMSDPSDIRLEREQQIASFKHNASRTATEQACDQADTMPEINRQERKSTNKGATTASPLKKEIQRAFKRVEEKYGLNLASLKKETLVDHFSRYPRIIAVAGTIERNSVGFERTGMKDRVSKEVPDLKVMIKETLRRPVTKKEWGLVLDNFVDLLKIMLEKGHIDDEEFLKRGFPADRNLNGEEVHRTSSMAQEHMHRAKIMDHQHQIAKRRDVLEKLLEKERQSLAKTKAKIDRMLEENHACEQKLFSVMGLPANSGREVLVHALLAHFHQCTRPMLRAFAFVRKHSDINASAGLPTVKGTLDDAAVPNAKTLTRVTFDLREEEVKIKAASEPTNSAAEAIVAARRRAVPNPERLQVRARGDITQYRFKATAEFISKTNKLFDPLEANPVNCADAVPANLDLLNEKAQQVHGVLHGRLFRHIELRLGSDKQKKESYVWEFVRKNMGRVAACMVSMDHVNDDVEVTKWHMDMSLLRSVDKNTFVPATTTELKELEECYLFYCKVSQKHIRSGTVVGEDRNIGKRHREHKNRADSQAVDDLDSDFYRLYPSKSSADHGRGMRRGHFEDLLLLCGLTFSRRSRNDIIELFEWDTHTEQRVDKLNIGTATLADKKLVMVGYLIELCYDLALSSSSNVSRNPGFERALGRFTPESN
jgi:hypothetical protein